MKKEIISEKGKKDAIQPIIGLMCALIVVILCGVFDVRKMGVEISSGIETIMYWVVRIICILSVPLILFLLIKFVKQLFKGEVLLRISEDGIYVNIHKNLNTTIKYEDIIKVSYKEYPNQQYIIFLFLKDPHKYLDDEQMERNAMAKRKVLEAGDIAIPSIFIDAKRCEVVELINSYLNA